MYCLVKLPHYQAFVVHAHRSIASSDGILDEEEDNKDEEDYEDPASSGGPVDLLDMRCMDIITENTSKHAAPTGDVFSNSSTC